MRQLYKFCTSFQVELRGHYSAQRIESLNKYWHSTSNLRALLITAMSPLPCLIIIAIVDCVPLAPPEAGSRANWVFWGRDCVSIALMTRVVLEEIRIVVPCLHMTPTQANMISIISSTTTIAFMIMLANSIGFPLPFALVVGIPGWAVVVVGNFAFCFGRALRQNEVLRRKVINFISVINCPVILVFVYPVYLYGFAHLESFTQSIYVGLLTFIKLSARNWMSYFLGTKFDLMSQMMIFNVDVFNVVYVSSSVQNSKSIVTTFIMIALDAVLAYVSTSDVGSLMRTSSYYQP
ncbi:unnamed protein product [Phytophthora lilii]|uniref:Unnamed protein product n=1 Tax=Phytophthora lilii TaxID=2077276 RepID=A0A9W6TAE8_9STRA|nr:unnamed protein product [Phytophthora lilii]